MLTPNSENTRQRPTKVEIKPVKKSPIATVLNGAKRREAPTDKEQSTINKMPPTTKRSAFLTMTA